MAKVLSQALIAAQDHGQKRAGVEVGGGEDAQLGQDRGGDLLGLVDEQHRAQAGGLDVGAPGLAQGPEAGPAVMGLEGHAEELAELAVEVGDAALRPGQDRGGEVREGLEVVGHEAQGHRLAGARLAGDKSETALAREGLDTPAEVIELGWAPQGVDRDVGMEGVPLQAVEGEQLRGVHAGSPESSSGESPSGSWGR